jgi:uncharacterized protein YqgV (UPF0045/DUF77 family)
MESYKHPLYYEIAHSFFDVRKQVDTFEAIIERFTFEKIMIILRSTNEAVFVKKLDCRVDLQGEFDSRIIEDHAP